MIEGYIIHLLIMVGIYGILAMSLNLALGYTGLLNMGHIAFFGLGAYTSALLTFAGVPFVLSFIAGGLLAAISSILLIWATNKLRGDYLALATLGFNFVIYSILINWSGLTGGPMGMEGIPQANLFGITITSDWGYLIFVVIIVIITYIVLSKIVNSPFGRLLQATRDDETGVKVLGKNTFALKAKSMATSAFFAGIAGSLLAHYFSYIDPTGFSIVQIILIFTIVIVGGIASLKGSVAAAILIIVIPELLRFLSLPNQVVGPMRQIVYALILLLILLYRPKGLFGRIDLQ